MQYQIREGLLSYVELLKETAQHNFERDLILYGLRVYKKAPTKPRILD